MSYTIVVDKGQRQNPVLKFLRNIRWQFGETRTGDYQVGDDAFVLFLSLKYHILNPDYIHGRVLQATEARCRRCILLLHVDTNDASKHLLDITHLATFSNVTLICAWSCKECARYLETLKVSEHKAPDLLKGQVEDTDYTSRVTDLITSIREVNKTDAATLLERFGSVAGIMTASEEQLSSCPGIGTSKVREIHRVFHEPFFASSSTAPPADAREEEK